MTYLCGPHHFLFKNVAGLEHGLGGWDGFSRMSKKKVKVKKIRDDLPNPPNSCSHHVMTECKTFIIN